MKRVIGVSAIALFSFFAIPEVSLARFIEVSPIIINKDLSARDIIYEQILIKNTSSAKRNVYAFVNNVSLGTDGKVEDFLDYNSSDRTTSLANWIEISRGVIELMPGEEKEIEFMIRVQRDAEPGKYHALISFGTGTNIDEAKRLLDKNSAVMVVASVQKDTQELLQVRKFSAGSGIFSDNTATFTYILQNNGDERVVPTGEILLYDRSGVEIGAVRVNGQGEGIEPGEEKEFSVEWTGDYKIGRHKAYLSAVYGSVNKNNLTDTTYFFMLPWKQLLFIFSTVVIALIYLTNVIHNAYAKKRKRPVYVTTKRPISPTVPGTDVINLKKYDE
ncbi:MAG: hypothetical protein WDZ88_02875 [Candidatus Paceibacterota bacterium]